MSCQVATPEQAKALQSELNEDLSNDSTRSLAPSVFRGSPDRRTTDSPPTCSENLPEGADCPLAGVSDPQMTALQKKITEARRQGDEAEVAGLTRQVADLSDKLGKERLNKLKSGQEGPVDPVVVDLCSASPPLTTGTNQAASKRNLQEIAQRMGQLPLVDGHVVAGEDRFSVRGGSAFSQGRTVHLSWMSLCGVSEGAPALVDWLCLRGCTDFKYDIHAGTGGSPEEDE